jgi:hypothetical protein
MKFQPVKHTPCIRCGEVVAPFGKAVDGDTEWRCHGCWLITPHAQALMLERVNKDDGDENEIPSTK